MCRVTSVFKKCEDCGKKGARVRVYTDTCPRVRQGRNGRVCDSIRTREEYQRWTCLPCYQNNSIKKNNYYTW